MLTTVEICCRCAFSPFSSPCTTPSCLLNWILSLDLTCFFQLQQPLRLLPPWVFFSPFFGNANLKCLPVQHGEILTTFLKGIFSLQQAKPKLAFPVVMWRHQLTSDFLALLSFWHGCFPESSAFQLVFQPLSTLGLSVFR